MKMAIPFFLWGGGGGGVRGSRNLGEVPPPINYVIVIAWCRGNYGCEKSRAQGRSPRARAFHSHNCQGNML